MLDVTQPMTDVELRALPRYCLATRYLFAGDPQQAKRMRQWGVTEAERTKWEEIFGPGFLHLHHYCWALFKVDRANQVSDGQQRSFLLRDSLGEFDYVIRNVKNDFIILPEIHVRKGLALQLLGDHASAVTEFLTAIDILPSYAPAYVGLSDSYIDLDKQDDARRVLVEGLRHAPNSKIIKRRLAAMERSSEKPP